MKTLFAAKSLLADGWKHDVAIVIGEHGRIERVEQRAHQRDDERVAGPLVPAMPNLHSHAFQRAIAGRTGIPSPSHDDTFWTWREAMYRVVDRLVTNFHLPRSTLIMLVADATLVW